MADHTGSRGLWIGEMATFDAFALAAYLGSRTSLPLTIGPLAVHVRTPVGMAMGLASVSALSGRPARLAIGTSSDVVVSGWHGRDRNAPARTLAQTAATLGAVLAGERGPGGYRLRLDPPNTPITVAAFGSGAVRVAARYADRMVLNMVTVDAVAMFRRALDAAADEMGKPRPALAVWLAVAVDPDASAPEQVSRALAMYVGAPGYGEMFTAAGHGELVERARSGAHPRDVLAAMSPAVLNDVAVLGERDAVLDRLRAYRTAGVDEVGVVPVTAGDPAGERTLTALASVAR